MKVEMEKTFPMPAQPEDAWALLQDLAVVAGCMPGAKITERVDDRHYKGTVSVRVGPASMAFRGELEVRELDTSSRMLHLIGKGSDTTGSSGASMDLVAHVEPANEGSQLRGRSEVTVSGKAAAFGGRMMSTIAEQILAQFARNFATELKARAPGTTAPASAVATPNGAATVPDRVAAAAQPQQAPGSAAYVANGGPPAAPLPPGVERMSAPQAMTPLAHPGRELSLFGLIWAITRDRLRALFRRRPA